jgi:hypothetical protein
MVCHIESLKFIIIKAVHHWNKSILVMLGINSRNVFFFLWLYYIVLYCIVLYCIVLYCIVLYCIVLYCIAVGGISETEIIHGKTELLPFGHCNNASKCTWLYYLTLSNTRWFYSRGESCNSSLNIEDLLKTARGWVEIWHWLNKINLSDDQLKTFNLLTGNALNFIVLIKGKFWD